jgi:feruloyl esterase
MILRYLSASLLLVAVFLAPPVHAGPRSLGVIQPVLPCAELAQTDLTEIGGPGSRVTKAAETTSAQGIAECAVDGTLAPSIGFQLVLPTRSWTQRYLQIGCGGLCGRISMEVRAAEGCVPLEAGGFAIAATDMGHQGSEEFGRDAQKRADFAHRAQHLTALAAKKLVARFYGRAPAYS